MNGSKRETRAVLLVEDNAADAELVRRMLRLAGDHTGYEVHHASRLRDAAELLRNNRIDVVLLDLRLPDASGTDCVKSLLQVSHEVPIVVLTGMADEALALACIDAGAQDYLNKEELRPILLRRAIGYSITRLREFKLREELQHAQKMEAVGLLAGGVAHDFNNLLLVMLVYAEMLRDECGTADPKYPELVEIVHAIDRAQALTRQLLAFSRKQPTEPVVLNLGDVITGFHSMLRRTLPASIEIVTLSPDEIWPVLADKGLLEQVLMNLAVNARDAMPDGGRFEVAIENRRIEQSSDHGVPAGDYVAARISDTGTGIAPEHLERIFDPFFTTKERGRGTGLGLSMCYGIIAQAGGQLTVESKPGAGTSFHILLPRTDRPAQQAGPAEDAIEHLRGKETILIVEDDQAVMRATVAALRRGGYRTVTAANGDEARRLLHKRRERVDLVLSDVVMPQLGGPELAELLGQEAPATPVIFMTGYSDYPVTTESGDHRIARHRAIMKPFRPSELLAIIRDVLDQHEEPERSVA
jgi:signal transduction histidine kinase